MQETRQVTQPLHIENTVLLMGRQDLSINNAVFSICKGCVTCLVSCIILTLLFI